MNNFPYLQSLQSLKPNSRIYIYGSGVFGRAFLFSIRAFRPDIQIMGFIDSFNNGMVLELPVIKVDDFYTVMNNYDNIILCANPMYWNEMINNLNENNIEKYFVNIYWDFDLYGKKDKTKYNKYKHLIHEVQNLLFYEEDKKIWDMITSSMKIQNIKVLLDYWKKHNKKIDYGKYVPLKKGAIVINGGASFGKETHYFARKVGKQGVIYAFDPKIAKDAQVNNKSIINNPMVLWDQTTKVSFREDNSRSMIIKRKEENAIEVQATTVDDFVKTSLLKRLDLIKLDVEGAELNVLRGGEDSIRKFRPSLAISIYHKYEHFFQIPLYINDLVKDYVFHIDCFNPYCVDTILFAIPIERQ